MLAVPSNLNIFPLDHCMPGSFETTNVPSTQKRFLFTPIEIAALSLFLSHSACCPVYQQDNPPLIIGVP